MKYEGYDTLSLYFKEISKIPLLKDEEEREIAKKASEGDEEAIKKLTTSNLRLVVRVAKKYQGNGLSLQDLISEGNEGLMKAIPGYDFQRGVKFISYAAWWIRQSIQKALCGSHNIRIPYNKLKNLSEIERLVKESDDELDYNSVNEIAEKLNISSSEVLKLLNINKSNSFDDPDYKKNLQKYECFKYNTEDDIIHKILLNGINKTLEKIPKRDADIIKYRYGLNGEVPHSLKETGEKYNISKERVRQIEKKALNKLKKKIHNSGILESYLKNPCN